MPCSARPGGYSAKFPAGPPLPPSCSPAAQRHRPATPCRQAARAPAPADAAPARGLIDAPVRLRRQNAPRHNLRNACALGVVPCRHAAHNDIPVRHHAAQPPVPAAHRQRADVVLRQEPRRHGDSLLRRNGNDPAAHDLFDLHCSPLPDKNRLPRRCRDRRSFLLVWERGRQIIPVLSYL